LLVTCNGSYISYFFNIAYYSNVTLMKYILYMYDVPYINVYVIVICKSDIEYLSNIT